MEIVEERVDEEEPQLGGFCCKYRPCPNHAISLFLLFAVILV
jgi:hypothetical protein